MSALRPGRPLPLALTIGEPAGIGPDITALAWLQRSAFQLPPFYCIADPEFLIRRARRMGLDLPVASVAPEEALDAFETALPVVATGSTIIDRPGSPDKAATELALDSIRLAVQQVHEKRAAAVVTNPVHKAALYAIGFEYPGHTEFLAALTSAPGKELMPVMMMAAPDLRTVPVTIHIALAEVPRRLTTDLIVATGKIVVADLTRRFRIRQPRLAVAGMNPHAGESGALGREDEDIVAPAVAILRQAGIAAVGPLPADSMFHAPARARYDAALCMYHDQALIPVKAIAFSDTVNVTLGLPIIRTSPDHGTAFDIAGTGTADPASLAAAMRLAAQLAANEAAFEPA